VSASQEFWEDYEVLRIETPEQLELRLPLAGFGPRFLALFVDVLLQSVVGVLLLVLATSIIVATMAMPGSEEAAEGAFWVIIAVMVLIFSVITVGYPLLFEIMWNGQTPGKRLTGIRVVRRGGLPLSFMDLLIRNLMRLVDYFPSHGLVGLVSFFATRYQQRLGDLAADTVVVREFSTRQPYAWSGGLKSDTPLTETGMLNPMLHYVISSYLWRRNELSTEARLRLTREMIARLGHESERLSLDERDAYLASILQSHGGVQA